MKARTLAAMLFAVAMMGQDAPKISAEEEAEWVKIRQIKALYEEAIANNQVEKLRPYIASSFHATLENGKEARSFDEMVTRNNELRALIGAGGTYKVAVKYQPGTMVGNYATAYGSADESVTTGSGKKFDFTSTWLANLVKENGEWKLHRLQATIDPVENVFVQDTVKYTKMFYGGGGLIVGAILGFLLKASRR